MEGAGTAMVVAEGGPHTKDLAGGPSAFGGSGSGGDVESSAKVSLEEMELGRWSNTHGLGCGYWF
jgi:hypothetical protein